MSLTIRTIALICYCSNFITNSNFRI